MSTAWDNMPVSEYQDLRNGQFAKISGNLESNDTVALKAREELISGDWEWGYPRDDIVLKSGAGKGNITLHLDNAYIKIGTHPSTTLKHATSGDYWANDSVVVVGTVKHGPNGTLSFHVKAMGPAGEKFDTGFAKNYAILMLITLVVPAIIIAGYEIFRLRSYKINSIEKAIHPKKKQRGIFQPRVNLQNIPNPAGLEKFRKKKTFWGILGICVLIGFIVQTTHLVSDVIYFVLGTLFYAVPIFMITMDLTMKISDLVDVPMSIGIGKDGVIFRFLLGKEIGFQWSDIKNISSQSYGDPRYNGEDPIPLTFETKDDDWSVAGVSYDIAVRIIAQHRSIVRLPSLLDTMKEIVKECEGDEKTLWLEAVAILEKAGMGKRPEAFRQ